MATSDENVSDMERKLIRQVEFYFGDFNLHRDKFMQEEMTKNDGWFTMDTMLKFQRLSSLCSEPTTILNALNKSKSNLMEVDEESQRIRRKPGKPLPEFNDSFRRDLKMRSVYIKGFPQTESIEDITDFLEEDYGKIDGIQLRRYNNPHQGSVFKGSLFATFNKLEDATKFIQAPMVYYKDKELEKMSKDEFWKQKEAEIAEVGGRKKQKKKNNSKDSTENVEKTEEVKTEEEFGWVQVSNLTDETITHVDIKQLLQEIGASECKFFSRYEKNGPTGYILFAEKSQASEMFSLLTEQKESCTVSIKSAPEVKFEKMLEEQVKEALSCYKEFRTGGKNKKQAGRWNKNKRKNKHIKFANSNGDEPDAKQAKVET